VSSVTTVDAILRSYSKETIMNNEPEKQTEQELLERLTTLLRQHGLGHSEEDAPTGACVYTAGSKTYCAVLEKSACDVLRGSWVQGGKC
jgi:hypothetical protein